MSKMPKVGVGVIIMKDEKILLFRRKNNPGAGSWSTPGGHLEYGETLEECAIRETREETGISISGIKFRAIVNDIFEKDKSHYITIWMEGSYVSGEPKVNEPNEVEKIGWFSWNDLPHPLFLPLRNLIEGRCYVCQPIKKKWERIYHRSIRERYEERFKRMKFQMIKIPPVIEKGDMNAHRAQIRNKDIGDSES